MAYICLKCIKEHELDEIADHGYPVGSNGFCEVCQPVFFMSRDDVRAKDWYPGHTVWVRDIVRSLDDPKYITEQLAEWAAIRFLVRLIRMT